MISKGVTLTDLNLQILKESYLLRQINQTPQGKVPDPFDSLNRPLQKTSFHLAEDPQHSKTILQIEKYRATVRLMQVNFASRKERALPLPPGMGGGRIFEVVNPDPRDVFVVKNKVTGEVTVFQIMGGRIRQLENVDIEQLKNAGFEIHEYELNPSDTLLIRNSGSGNDFAITATHTGNIIEAFPGRDFSSDQIIHYIKERIIEMAKRETEKEKEPTALEILTKEYSPFDFSPEATAAGIFKFITSLYELYKKGREDSPETFERFYKIVKDAAQKGFDQALQILGALPEEIQEQIDKTHKLLFEGLEQWREKILKERFGQKVSDDSDTPAEVKTKKI